MAHTRARKKTVGWVEGRKGRQEGRRATTQAGDTTTNAGERHIARKGAANWRNLRKARARHIRRRCSGSAWGSWRPPSGTRNWGENHRRGAGIAPRRPQRTARRELTPRCKSQRSWSRSTCAARGTTSGNKLVDDALPGPTSLPLPCRPKHRQPDLLVQILALGQAHRLLEVAAAQRALRVLAQVRAFLVGMFHHHERPARPARELSRHSHPGSRPTRRALPAAKPSQAPHRPAPHPRLTRETRPVLPRTRLRFTPRAPDPPRPPCLDRRQAKHRSWCFLACVHYCTTHAFK
jgi:hypothetical protein